MLETVVNSSKKSDLAKMETMVNVSGGDWSRKNRHGSLMTVEQIVKLEEARQGLYRKLNKSSRFKSLYGEEDKLSRSFGQSNCEYIENGVPGSASLKHGESRKLNGEIMTRNHSFKAPSVNNNYMQNGFSSDDSELPTGPPPRVVIVERKSNGDFDLVLREVTVLRRGMGKTQKQERSVVLIESRSPLSPSIFIPGDRVIEVNDTQVEDMACSEVWNWINRSENKVRLKVQPIPELNELSMRTGVNGEKFSVQEQCIQTGTLKRTGSRRYLWGKDKQKAPESVVKEHPSGMRVWLVHKGGFALAEILRPCPNDSTKFIVKLQHSDREIEVGQKDVEKANPPSYDRVEDLSSLPYLNESSFLNTLRQRFCANLTHTYVGQTLVVFNPMQSLTVYSDKVLALFHGCQMEDMPPHIYATAQAAYRNMMDTGQNQSLVLMGHSGSGKTTNLKQILYYYTVVAKPTENFLNASKLDAVFILLEAFGNSRTIQNASATRFLQTTSVEFDRGGVMTAISIQALMLERTRIFRRPEGEPTFHIFYQMLNGLETNLRRELFLESLVDSNLLLKPLKMPDSQHKTALTWNKISQAMSSLLFTPNEIRAICSVLTAIYHLGCAGYVKGSGGRRHRFARPAAARHAANVLGSTLGELSDLVFNHQHLLSSSEQVSGLDLIEDFVVSLYSELFQAVICLINRSLRSKRNGSSSIVLFDSAGFQNPASCGRVTGGSFEDLCSNYLHERLQALFKDSTVISRLDLYDKNLFAGIRERPAMFLYHLKQENIKCDLTNVSSVSQSQTLGLVDGRAGNRLGSSVKLTSSSAPIGLFPVLDEVRTKSSATDEMIRQTFLNQYKSNSDYGSDWVRDGGAEHLLMVSHVHGANPVLYDVRGWIKSTRQMDAYRQAVHKILVKSNRQEIKSLFNMTDNGGTDVQNISVCRKIIMTIDSVIESLKKTKLRFILCLSPRFNAGLCDVTANAPHKIPSQKSFGIDDVYDDFFHEPYVRAQIHGYELTNTARLYRQGFPENMFFEEFVRRYGILVPAEERLATDDIRESVQQILDYMKMDKDSYQLGRKQVFFQADALSMLNDARDEKISIWAEKLQVLCRGWLGRRKLEKLKRQRDCIEIVQNNVRIMAAIKDWSWWKLFSKVRPLVQANILEQEKKLKAAEMEELKTKLEKIEKEKNELKEAVNLMGTSKSRRRDAGDDDADDVMESSYGRSLGRYSSNLDSEGDDDEDTFNQLYRDKYENARRQGDLERKKMQREHEDTVEDILSSKKLMEKKLNHALEDIEEQQSLLDTVNKKSLQYSKDISELKSRLEEQKMQNEDLDEKRKKYETEIQRLNDLLKTERKNKEKLEQEKDEIEERKRSTELKLQDIENDLEMEADKNRKLQQELKFMTTTKKDDEELAQLRKLKVELERRCQKQEEELDKQEAILQQLEVDKVQLEAQQDKLKQQQTRIQRDKDEELEEFKKLFQKKIQGMMAQLEEEASEKEKLVDQKVEMERKLQLMVEPDRAKELKLRRKLKRVKVLLNDSRLSSSPGGMKALRQLKDELEDALLSAAAALRAKKVVELELIELQARLEIAIRNKDETEDRCRKVLVEHTELQSKLNETHDDFDDMLKKYKALVQQNSLDLARLQEQSDLIEELHNQLEKKKEENDTLQSRLHFQQSTTVSQQIVLRLEAKIKELEAITEMERTTSKKSETNLSRLKVQWENDLAVKRKLEAEQGNAQALNRKLEREIRDLKDQLRDAQAKESEITLRNQQLEKKMSNYELECEKYNEELLLTNKRLAVLQKTLTSEQFGLHSDEDEEWTEDDFDDVASLNNWSNGGYNSNSLLLSPKRSLEEQSEA